MNYMLWPALFLHLRADAHTLDVVLQLWFTLSSCLTQISLSARLFASHRDSFIGSVWIIQTCLTPKRKEAT